MNTATVTVPVQPRSFILTEELCAALTQIVKADKRNDSCRFDHLSALWKAMVESAAK